MLKYVKINLIMNYHSESSPQLLPVVGINNTSLLGHDSLRDALELSATFVADESVFKGKYLEGEFADFTDVVSSVPGVIGTFATGYPFYAQKPDGGIHDIPEIQRYIGEFSSKVTEDEARGLGGWLCGMCDVVLELPDLKQECKPCDVVSIKPRDIFRAMPDLDFWVIAEDNALGSALEVTLQREVEQAGYVTSDVNILGAIASATEVMTSVAKRSMPRERLPIDLHIVGFSQFADVLKRAPDAIARKEMLPIAPRSWHKRWEKADPYDAAKDYLFSLTPGKLNSKYLISLLADSRAATKEMIAHEEPVELVAARAAKEARQLQTPGVKSALLRRIASW